MVYTTQAAFTEAPDGIITTFTSTIPFVDPPTVVRQRSEPITYTITNETTIETDTPPEAALGSLYWAGNSPNVIDDIDTTWTLGFWLVSRFQELYSGNISTIIDALLSADSEVRNYVTADSYTQALLLRDPYLLFRRVISELAGSYLTSRPGTGQVISSEKSYADNVKKMKQQYKMVDSKTPDEILAQLITYKQPRDETSTTLYGASTDWWGTGRHFGL